MCCVLETMCLRLCSVGINSRTTILSGLASKPIDCVTDDCILRSNPPDHHDSQATSILSKPNGPFQDPRHLKCESPASWPFTFFQPPRHAALGTSQPSLPRHWSSPRSPFAPEYQVANRDHRPKGLGSGQGINPRWLAERRRKQA